MLRIASSRPVREFAMQPSQFFKIRRDIVRYPSWCRLIAAERGCIRIASSRRARDIVPRSGSWLLSGGAGVHRRLAVLWFGVVGAGSGVALAPSTSCVGVALFAGPLSETRSYGVARATFWCISCLPQLRWCLCRRHAFMMHG